jgi:hypothetical protein
MVLSHIKIASHDDFAGRFSFIPNILALIVRHSQHQKNEGSIHIVLNPVKGQHILKVCSGTIYP